MPYNHFEHRHRFAVWAAARAAQRGFTDVETLRDAIESTTIRAFLEEKSNFDIDDTKFDSLHREWCNQIVTYLKNKELVKATYGRAAKLVAVYLKSMVVVAQVDCRLARVAHPPIDWVLLKNMASTTALPSKDKPTWRKTRWTKLSESDYFALLQSFRSVIPESSEWWRLEEYWTVTNLSDASAP